MVEDQPCVLHTCSLIDYPPEDTEIMDNTREPDATRLKSRLFWCPPTILKSLTKLDLYKLNHGNNLCGSKAAISRACMLLDQERMFHQEERMGIERRN
jgi:hypothetical protein